MSDPRPLSLIVKSAGTALLDLVLPAHCPACGVMVEKPGALCANCWSDMTFIDDPLCAACGLPMAFDPGLGFDQLCGACHQQAPDFDQARAVFVYDDHSRHLILRYKHGDRLDLTPGFISWLGRVGAPWLREADMVIPVPLHWSRLLKRRYNQAAELARGLAKAHGVAYQPSLLKRKRPTKTQGGQSRTGRHRNVQGAFHIAPSAWPDLEGARVVLIDDVLTTGATVNACAKALKKAGVSHVAVLTLARVPGPEG